MIEAPTIYQIALPVIALILGGGALAIVKITGRRLDAEINRAKEEAVDRAAEPEMPKMKPRHGKVFGIDIAGHVVATMQGPYVVHSKPNASVIAARRYRLTHSGRRYSKSQGRASLVD